MKRTLSILLAVAMLFGLLPLSAVAADKTPADFGWYTDNSNFSGWTADEDGTAFTVSYDGTNSKRIWKPVIEDPQNFEISLDVDILAVRGYVQVLGVMLELNPSGGNGDQIYCPQYGNWFNAAGQAAKVTMTRENGGDLNVTLAGVNGDTVSFTRTPGDGSNTNLELGVIDAGGSALFSNLTLGKEEEEENPPAASDKSPADFGWYTDNNNFSGWTTDEDGTTFTVSYDGTNAKRMWKPVIEDPQNFEISLDVDILAVRGYVQVLGVMLELNPSGGNGDQIYCPQYGNWFNAAGQAAKVTMTRENGGDLNVTLAGVNGDTVTFSRTPVDGGNTNLELGVIDNGGSAQFSNLTIREEEETPVLDKSPAEFGWYTDNADFTGWTADETGTVFALTYGLGATRMWKNLLQNTGDFTVDVDVDGDSNTAAYLQVCGIIVELNATGGNGDQAYIKVGGVGYDWLSGSGCKFHVSICRQNGGDLTVTVTGEGNATPFTKTIAPTQDNENLELGLYRGAVSFSNVAVVCAPAQPSEVSVKISHTVSFDSDLQMNYRIKYENIAAAVPGYVTEGAYLLVEKDRYPMGGGEKTVETVTLQPDLVSDPDRMLFSLPGIQSVEMGSELRAVLHFFDEAGNEYYTQIDIYSVLAYAQLCYDSYTHEEKPELYTLLIDCLNYGAAAQAAFDRRADEPVNAGMEAYQQYATTQLSSELTDVRTYVENQRSITAVTAMGFSVNFADKTEINAKLTIADGYSKQDITAVKVLNENGEEVATLTEFTELDDGRLQVTFTGVKSVNMRDMYYFVAYVGEEIASQNVGYSVEAYARSNINSADAKLAQLVRATMYYGDAAASCFRAG